jgi:hypothetical protein
VIDAQGAFHDSLAILEMVVVVGLADPFCTITTFTRVVPLFHVESIRELKNVLLTDAAMNIVGVVVFHVLWEPTGGNQFVAHGARGMTGMTDFVQFFQYQRVLGGTFGALHRSIFTLNAHMIQQVEMGALKITSSMGTRIHLIIEIHDSMQNLVRRFFAQHQGIHGLVAKNTPLA